MLFLKRFVHCVSIFYIRETRPALKPEKMIAFTACLVSKCLISLCSDQIGEEPGPHQIYIWILPPNRGSLTLLLLHCKSKETLVQPNEDSFGKNVAMGVPRQVSLGSSWDAKRYTHKGFHAVLVPERRFKCHLFGLGSIMACHAGSPNVACVPRNRPPLS